MPTTQTIAIALLILVPVLIVGRTFLTRRAAAWGKERGEAWARNRRGPTDGLETAVGLLTDVPGAVRLVEPLLGAAKGAQRLDAQTWAMNYSGVDDVHIGVRQGLDGVVVHVLRSVPFGGGMVGGTQWRKLRPRILAAATAAAIPTRDVVLPLAPTARTLTTPLGGLVIWASADA